MGMALMEEKQLFRLLNEAKRNYNTLEGCDERHPALLCYFKEQIKSIIESYDEIKSNHSSLSQRLEEDIRTFIHNVDLSFFTRYKEFFCNTTEEHIAIESIFDIVDEFHYLYPLENKNKHQHKPSKTLQASNGLPEELSTDKAKKILEAAVSANLATKVSEYTYQWNDSISLLLYFIRRSNKELNITTKFGKENWKIWSTIFNEDASKLRQRSRSDMAKCVFMPRNAGRVNDLYKWETKL